MEDTRARVARRVRIAARDKGITKSALRDALGFTDWRSIKPRWDGDLDYTVTQLHTVSEIVEVPMAALCAGADASEETADVDAR